MSGMDRLTGLLPCPFCGGEAISTPSVVDDQRLHAHCRDHTCPGWSVSRTQPHAWNQRASQVAPANDLAHPNWSKPIPGPYEQWPPIKKALWEVIMGTQINVGYVAALPLVERLYAAVQAAPVPVGSGMYGEYTPITVGAGTTVKTPAPSDGLRGMLLDEMKAEFDDFDRGWNAAIRAAPSDGLREALSDMIALFSADGCLLKGTHLNATLARARAALSASPAQEGEPRHD